MKPLRHLITLLPLLACLLLTLACGEDRWPEYYPLTGRDLWIDSVMRVNYLWVDDLPSTKKLNYFQAPATFLKNLTVSADKYSTVDTLYTVAETGYGFEYSLYKIDYSDSCYNALVTYVSTDSPAADAGLERGDWIMLVDGDSLTKNNEALLQGGEERRLQLGKYILEIVDDSLQTDTTWIEPTLTASLPAEREVSDDVIPVSTIISLEGTPYTVGYLVYNSFTAGTEADASAYDNRLRQFSLECQAAGITDFVLDLRYNTGGELACMQLLADLLAPYSALGHTLASFEYNELRSADNCSIDLGTRIGEGGANLNLSTLYVLTSSSTVGVGEIMVNCLRPYMDVVLIGQTTTGQTVHKESFINTEFSWRLSPVVAFVYNANGTADYSSGLKPDYSLTPTSYLQYFLPLGNAEELLLRQALTLIKGGEEEED